MSRPHSDRSLHNLSRFYRYALPYWRIILLALLVIAVNGAVTVNAIVLIGPATQAIKLREDAAKGKKPEPAEHQKAEKPVSAIKQMQKKAGEWVANLSVAKKLKQWFYPEPSLKRIAFALVAILAPLVLLSGFLSDYLQGVVVWRIMVDLRVDLFRKISSLSLGYFSGHRTGELVSRLTNDLNQTQQALRIIFGRVIRDPFVAVILLGAALWSSWQLTLLGMTVFPLVVFSMSRFGRNIRHAGTKTLARLADVTDSITQVLAGIRVVKSFNMEDAELDEFRERNRLQLKRAIKLVRNRALGNALPDFLMIIPFALIAYVGDRLLSSGELNLDTMMTCFACLAFMGGPVRRTVKAYNDLQQSLAGVNRMFELLDTEPAIQDAPDAVELTGVSQGVSFNDVRFSYGDTPVLRGIELEVPRGNVYAVVGETGAGKSTMLDLIPRFHDVTDGSITIDGLDVRHVTRDSLMRQIAIVGQHPFLFNRPIAENIRYGKPDATDQEVEDAARAANIHDFIAGLPDGYQTPAGEAGARFSGGQRQCVTIARAILKNAPILILDEATSSLDAESEMLVQRALGNLMEGRTTFVIAHRLSTVRHADRIVVLKDGRIVEEGTHEELLELGGEYSRLYRLQFADAPAVNGEG